MRKPASLGTILPPVVAVSVGTLLLASYVAPFYDALDHDNAGAGTEIVIEDFDMPEDMPESIHEEGLPSGVLADNNAHDPAPEANDIPAGVEGTGAAEQPAAEPQALERIEARPPLSDLGLATMPPEPLPESSAEQSAEQELSGGLLYHPVAVAAGRLEAGGQIIELAGVDIVEPEAACVDIGGEVWQCGMQARTAFRSWLRGRAVQCNVEQAENQPQVIRTSCTMGGTDLAQWLVENGWARAKFGGAYSDAQQQAEQNLRGVFGRKPNADLPPMPDTTMTTLPPLVQDAVPLYDAEGMLLPDAPREIVVEPQLPVEQQNIEQGLPFPPAP